MEMSLLIERYPVLFHMAEKDTWPDIRDKGLLSTSAALDRYNLTGTARAALEVLHRPEKVAVGTEADRIVLRDQKPMHPSRLEKALIDGTTPSEWYAFLNNKVFMWAEEKRLFGLLNARGYRKLEHDVLTIDTKALMEVHGNRVWLCHMNSGNTFPMPHARGMDTFRRIPDFPPNKNVVEVVVDYSIPDVAKFVREVRRIRGTEVLQKLPLQ